MSDITLSNLGKYPVRFISNVPQNYKLGNYFSASSKTVRQNTRNTNGSTQVFILKDIREAGFINMELSVKVYGRAIYAGATVVGFITDMERRINFLYANGNSSNNHPYVWDGNIIGGKLIRIGDGMRTLDFNSSKSGAVDKVEVTAVDSFGLTELNPSAEWYVGFDVSAGQPDGNNAISELIMNSFDIVLNQDIPSIQLPPNTFIPTPISEPKYTIPSFPDVNIPIPPSTPTPVVSSGITIGVLALIYFITKKK